MNLFYTDLLMIIKIKKGLKNTVMQISKISDTFLNNKIPSKIFSFKKKVPSSALDIPVRVQNHSTGTSSIYLFRQS